MVRSCAPINVDSCEPIMWARAFAVLVIICFQHVHGLRTDQQFWNELAQRELEEALQVKWNLGAAKNVVLFVGDGMGPNTVTATRIYKGGETHRLAYETFPHVGLLKTYSANKMVPDSSSTATALFCGVKVNQETIGVDASVAHKDYAASLRTEARLKSLAALALEAGKSAGESLEIHHTGFVTTMRVTHATPAPIYAHSASRSWECDAKMPAGSGACKDIARQLVEDWPGRDLHVIMGGGRQGLVTNCTSTEDDPVEARWGCVRGDGRDLVRDYRRDKESRGLNYSVLSNNQDLWDVDFKNTDYLLGVFANSHMQYEHLRDKGSAGQPSIADMTAAAIKVLRNNDNGFFLMVEGGNIDMAHHRGVAKQAVSESAALEAAVRAALALLPAEHSLLVVTSDHAHTLNINGYPYRGTNIFGITSASSHEHRNYTTLSYSNGGPGSFHYSVVQEGNHTRIARRDPSGDDTDSFQYEQIAGITLEENIHGGGDVAIYAKGPHAHLFHSVHEQHYVYHALAHAARLRPPAPAAAAALHPVLPLAPAVLVAHLAFYFLGMIPITR